MKRYPLRELWLYIGREDHYDLPLLRALPDLEKFVIETDPIEQYSSELIPRRRWCTFSPLYSRTRERV